MNWCETYFVWPPSIAKTLNAKGVDPDPEKYLRNENVFDASQYKSIESGDVVFLRTRFLPQFSNEIKFNGKIILVLYDGDEHLSSFSNYLKLNDKFFHVFAQNCDYTEQDNISYIPIGIDYHTIAYRGGGWGEEQMSPKEQERQITLCLFSYSFRRKRKAFVDFQHSDTMRAGFKRHLQFGEDRQTIFKKLLKTNLIDHGPRMKRSDLWFKKRQYVFSISPHGNGYDTHRTWEDLILGNIVIVKTSPLDLLYEELPVVIVKDWNEINEANFEKWENQFSETFGNPHSREKLTNKYWINKIKEQQSKIV